MSTALAMALFSPTSALAQNASAGEYGGSEDNRTPTTAESVAPEALKLRAGASFLSRYEVREGYDAAGIIGRRFGEGDWLAYRARLTLASEPIALSPDTSIDLYFAPQASGVWGAFSGQLVDTPLQIHEGKLSLRHTAGELSIGRLELVYGEHLVIGNVDWHETGRAFDGARWRQHVSDDGAFVDAFVTYITEGAIEAPAPTAFAGGDTYFAGLYAGLGPLLVPGMALDTYSLMRLWPRREADDDTAAEMTLGTRIKHTLGPAMLRLEAGVQIGTRPGVHENILAYQADGELLFDVLAAHKLGLGALYATGDDPATAKDEAWNQLYPTAHKFLGLMDLMGARTNATAASVRWRFKATSELSAAMDGHAFWRPQSASSEHYAGSEADLWVNYLVGKGATLRAQYSLFVPNEAGPFGSSDPVHYAEFQLRFDSPR